MWFTHSKYFYNISVKLHQICCTVYANLQWVYKHVFIGAFFHLIHGAVFSFFHCMWSYIWLSVHKISVNAKWEFELFVCMHTCRRVVIPLAALCLCACAGSLTLSSLRQTAPLGLTQRPTSHPDCGHLLLYRMPCICVQKSEKKIHLLRISPENWKGT